MLPSKRPHGNGEVAQLWMLGGTLGKTAVLAGVTFIAYLVGSFLEIRPDGSYVRRVLAPIVLVTRKPWYWEALEGDKTTDKTTKTDQDPFAESNARVRSMQVKRSISADAKLDLVELLQRRNAIDVPSRADLEEVSIKKRRYTFVYPVDAVERAVTYYKSDSIISDIINEMPQLASRLLVTNKDLYSKYDKLMAEADFRINVAIPLTLFLILATWFSTLPIWLRVTLTIVAIIAGVYALPARHSAHYIRS